MAPDRKHGHLPALDGLRGLAVVAVLFFHAGKMPGGFLGVDLFFALSGFLITTLLLAEVQATHRVHLLAFWGRRFRRLLPAVLFLLVVVTVITTIVASVPERAATLDDGPWVQAYLANWHAIAGNSGYWASFDLPRMFGHLWSLAIEEQFYVVWPLLIALIAWRTKHLNNVVIIVCIVASALSLVQMIHLFDPTDPSRVYIGTDTRASSLLLGAICAAAPVQIAAMRLLGARRFNVIGSLIVGVLGAAWFVVDGPTSPWLFRGGLFAHSLLSGVLVLGCATNPEAWLSHVLGWEPFRAIGEMSYSLYLWHWPIYTLLSPDRTDLSGWGLIAVRLLVSGAAAAISKYMVEDPVRFRAPWARGRRGAVVLVAAMSAVALFWLAVPQPNTTAAVFTVDQLATTTTAPTTSTTTPSTTPSTTSSTVAPGVEPTAPVSTTVPITTTTTTVPVTTTTLLPATSRVLVVGDSVAFDLWPGVEAALVASNVTAYEYARPGVSLLDTRYASVTEIEAWITQISPDLVIYLASLWDYGTVESQQAAYQRFTEFVLGRGARVVLITIPPLRDDQHNDALTPLSGIMTELAAQHPGLVQVLDSNGAWGATFAQDVNLDGVPERKPDGVHVCPSGSAMYANWLLGELANRFADFVAASPEAWATGAWTNDPRYTTPDGICAALT